MSAGPFEEGKYEDDTGLIWRCKVQPETKNLSIQTVGNDYPSGALTTGLPRLKTRVSRGTQGIRPRYVVVELTADGTGGTIEYKAGTKHQVIVFNPTVYGAWELNTTGTYLGIPCKLVFKSGEASS